jgi:hypothetical protein
MWRHVAKLSCVVCFLQETMTPCQSTYFPSQRQFYADLGRADIRWQDFAAGSNSLRQIKTFLKAKALMMA